MTDIVRGEAECTISVNEALMSGHPLCSTIFLSVWCTVLKNLKITFDKRKRADDNPVDGQISYKLFFL